MSIAAIIRPEVAAYAPYRPSKIGADIICLNANESADAIDPDQALNRYPENRPSELGARLASLY